MDEYGVLPCILLRRSQLLDQALICHLQEEQLVELCILLQQLHLLDLELANRQRHETLQLIPP